jgi:glutamate-ammonia-ligase adenylyltransferase
MPPAGPWDIKLRQGGQIEVEFIAQALQLVHARAHPEILHANLPRALSALGEAGLIPAETAARLIEADLFWRSVQGILRITEGPAIPQTPSGATLASLSRALAGSENTPLSAAMDRHAAEVHQAFVQLLGGNPP